MSTYHGRHRPPTRAERRARVRRSPLPKSLTRAHALPTVAAVALALTAAGATAAQSSNIGGAATAAFSAGGTAESAGTQAVTASQDTSSRTERREKAAATDAETRDDRDERAGRSDSRRERSSRASATAAADRSAAERKDESESRDWVEPLDDAVFTSPYGQRWGRLHAGQDYAADIGTPLKSMGTGEVVGAGPMGGYGTYLDIRYTDGTVSRYGHLDSVSVSVGQQVEPGDVVAKSGNTGQSTGPHLHLEIRPGGGDPIDPAPWLAERGID